MVDARSPEGLAVADLSSAVSNARDVLKAMDGWADRKAYRASLLDVSADFDRLLEDADTHPGRCESCDALCDSGSLCWRCTPGSSFARRSA